MPNVSLQSLRTSLQDGGVSSAYINRLMAELDDHYEDLEWEERASGSERPAAAVEAFRRLGQQDAIAAAVLAKPELCSWAHRWPWLAGLMSHVLLLLLLPIAPVVACAQRGPAIVRWSVSISLGAALTGGFLLVMAQSIFATL